VIQRAKPARKTNLFLKLPDFTEGALVTTSINSPWVLQGSALGRLQRWLLTLLAFLAALWLPLAQAVPICIPNAGGVPALPGPPNWLNAAAGEPNFWPRQDDPRWRGASSRSLGGSGASEHASFRALRDASALYLSWHVKAAPLMNSAEALNLAISPGGGAADQLLVIYPNNVAGALATELNVVPPQMISNISHLRGAGGAWGAALAMPAWVAANTRVSRNQLNGSWSINMRVPVAAAYDAGINLASNFRIWYQLDVNTAGGQAQYINSSNPLNNLEWVFSQTNSGNWEEFNRTLASSDPLVCARGISLDVADVGTKNVDAGGVPRPNRISLTGANTFFAHPKNNTAAPVPASAICAQFRVANWGTQPDWNNVPDPTNSLWKLISAACPVGPNNPGAIAAGAKADVAAPAVGANEISLPWTMSPAERCEFTGSTGVPSSGIPAPPPGTCPPGPPTRRLHQCMLVELSGGGQTYTPASVYRNMDFVNASVFTREAEVSVAGLTPLGAAPRDVFLYVQTRQLPKDINRPQPGDTLLDWSKASKFSDPRLPGTDIRRQPVTIGDGAQPPVRPPLGEPFELLNQIYPTYVVHAYNDSGRTVTRKGVVYKVLQPQSSFGYYVHHDGALTGWAHELQGATQIAPDFYRIAVPEGGTRTVTTRIEARGTATASNRYVLWLALGSTFPHGSFGNQQKSGLAANLGFEYLLTPAFSVEASLGRHSFGGKNGGGDIDVTQIGVNSKWYFAQANFKPFLTAGVSGSAFAPGSTRLGVNLGAGVQVDLAQQWSLEGRYTLHQVTGNSPNSRYSTLLFGLRYAF
jgi:Outer membrane protein beta-barrel domain